MIGISTTERDRNLSALEKEGLICIKVFFYLSGNITTWKLATIGPEGILEIKLLFNPFLEGQSYTDFKYFIFFCKFFVSISSLNSNKSVLVAQRRDNYC